MKKVATRNKRITVDIDPDIYECYLKYENEAKYQAKKEKKLAKEKNKQIEEYDQKEDVNTLAHDIFRSIIDSLAPKRLKVIKIPKEVPSKFEKYFEDSFWDYAHEYSIDIFDNYTIRSSRPKQKKVKNASKKTNRK